ncbi:hypothetical protein BGW80DRAFT_850216 [Lactifluus volemus]|nr:hypothetical protein BGW80DRAFT_850216 [Lactifluus volemus]
MRRINDSERNSEANVEESTSTGNDLAQIETSEDHVNFFDGSGAIFNMYTKLTEQDDNKLVHRLQNDADRILIFTGFLSAVNAVFISVSIHDLKPGSQDTSAFYLRNIYQLLADSNVSILASSAEPPPFSPPRSAIWVNSLWFLSLGFSLTCALLATSLQQWTRRYIKNTQSPRYRDSPHKRARIRAFFAGGINKLGLPRFVEVLATLLHLSLFLFFSGLLIFVFHINHTLFLPVAGLTGILATLYSLFTVVPILRHDSPYYSPISLSIWHLYARFSYEAFSILTFISSSHYFKRETWARFKEQTEASRKRLSQSMAKTVQDTVSKLSAQLDGQVLRWTFDALREDHEMEQFFKGIPDFCRSKVVTNPKQVLAKLSNAELARALATFLNHTWSPNSLSEKVEARRLMVCMKAIDTLDRQHLPMDFLYELCKQGEDRVFLHFVFARDNCWRHCRGTETRFPMGGSRLGPIREIVLGILRL